MKIEEQVFTALEKKSEAWALITTLVVLSFWREFSCRIDGPKIRKTKPSKRSSRSFNDRPS